MKIAILGSSSHIAKGLIHYFQHNELECYSRQFGDKWIYNFQPFGTKYDLIINCVGYGTPSKIKTLSYDDIDYYNHLDSTIIKYLKVNPTCKYINMSSWVVTQNITESHRHYVYYINKLFQEMKHRLCRDLNIIDIRIPAYFSRWIDINSGFLMTNIIKHLHHGEEFKATSNQFNYYITPKDLYNLIMHFNKESSINKYINLVDYIKPVKTSELLESFFIEHDLEDIPDNHSSLVNPDWKPEYTSLEGVIKEYQEWMVDNG